VGPEPLPAGIGAEDMFTGQNYEERKRGFRMLRGQFTHFSEGELGLQLHMRPPIQVEFRNILLKNL